MKIYMLIYITINYLYLNKIIIKQIIKQNYINKEFYKNLVLRMKL